TPPKMPPPSPPPSLLLEGEEEEQSFVEDQALYYVHRKDWAYWQKGKSAKKSWTGDKQGMVKCIVASRKKKSLAMAAAKKALAAVHKTHGKRVRKSKNKGLKRKVFWAR
ncbi:unnamed protein product, partial [Effrenium voratum]